MKAVMRRSHKSVLFGHQLFLPLVTPRTSPLASRPLFHRHLLCNEKVFICPGTRSGAHSGLAGMARRLLCLLQGALGSIPIVVGVGIVRLQADRFVIVGDGRLVLT